MQFNSMESEASSATARGALPQTAMPANGGSFAETSQMQTLHKQLQSALKEIGMLRQQALAESQSQTSLSGLDGEPGVSGNNMWRPAWDGFVRGFVLAYGIRAGLGTMTRALALARAGQYKDMRGWRLFSERGLQYREDAVRLGLFVGGFTGSYHLISGALAKWQASLPPAQNCMAAGTAAGLTLMFLSRERRRTLALYMLARIAQCLYNSLKQQGRFHLWGSDWAYGDALLFALSSAQVMYAYVMRPETLPKSYWKFIVKSGPIETPALEAVRRSLRKLPIDLQAFNAFIKKRGGTAFLTTAFPKQITDAMLHPQTASALLHNLKVPWATFRKTFPLYMSISLVPYVVLNLKRALRNPLGTAAHAVGSAVRSTSFLAAFVGVYSSVISLQRKLFSWDHKLLYYVAGLAASGSILIEKKSRRSELALYVMPRGVDAFVLAMTKRRWVPSVKFGEVILFSLCMGGLMYYRQHEPDTMAPMLNTLISRIVFGQTKKSRPDLPRPASITFSEGDFPGGHQEFEGSSTQASPLANSPTKSLAPAAMLGNSPDKGSMEQAPASRSTSHQGYAAQPLQSAPGSRDSPTTVSTSPQPDMDQGSLQQPLPSTSHSHQGTAQSAHSGSNGEADTLHAHQSLTGSGDAHQSSIGDGQSQTDGGIGADGHGRITAGTDQQSSTAGAGSSTNGHEEAGNGDDGTTSQAEAVGSEMSTDGEGARRDDLVGLVQGTEHLIGMLQARDLS